MAAATAAATTTATLTALGLFTLALLFSQPLAAEEAVVHWHQVLPHLDTFSSYEDMQRYFDHRNQRSLRQLENPLDDTYVDAFNRHNEQSVQRSKRSTENQKELPQMPTLIRFEISDAVEPSDEVKALIRQYRSREVQQAGTTPPAKEEASKTKAISKRNPNTRKMSLKTKNSFNKFPARPKRSAGQYPQQPKNFKVQFIPFDESDAREPDEQTRELIRRMKAMDIEKLSKDLVNPNLPGITQAAMITMSTKKPTTTTRRPKYQKQRKNKRTKRGAPEMIKFELADAKDPDSSLKSFSSSPKKSEGRESKDLKAEDQVSDSETNDQHSQASKRFFIYKDPNPIKVKKSVASLPHGVQNIISQIIKNPPHGKAFLKYIPAQQMDYNKLKISYPKAGQPIYGHGGNYVAAPGKAEQVQVQIHSVPVVEKIRYVYTPVYEGGAGGGGGEGGAGGAGGGGHGGGEGRYGGAVAGGHGGGAGGGGYGGAVAGGHGGGGGGGGYGGAEGGYAGGHVVAYIAGGQEAGYGGGGHGGYGGAGYGGGGHGGAGGGYGGGHGAGYGGGHPVQVVGYVEGGHAAGYGGGGGGHGGGGYGGGHGGGYGGGGAQEGGYGEGGGQEGGYGGGAGGQEAGYGGGGGGGEAGGQEAGGYASGEQGGDLGGENGGGGGGEGDNGLSEGYDGLGGYGGHGGGGGGGYGGGGGGHGVGIVQPIVVPEAPENAAEEGGGNEVLKAVPAPQFKGGEEIDPLLGEKLGVAPTVEQYSKAYANNIPTHEFKLKLYSPEALIAKAQLEAKLKIAAIEAENKKITAALKGGGGGGGGGGGKGGYAVSPAVNAKGPLIKIEYHAAADAFKDNYKDSPEFKQLSSLVGKSPEDQIHGLTYLLAKEMQNRLHGKQKYGEKIVGGGGLRPQDNKAPQLFHPGVAAEAGLGGGKGGGEESGGGGGGRGGGAKYIGMAKAKQYVPVIEQYPVDEYKVAAAALAVAGKNPRGAGGGGGGLGEKYAAPHGYMSYGLSPNYKPFAAIKAVDPEENGKGGGGGGGGYLGGGGGGEGGEGGGNALHAAGYEAAIQKMQSYASKYAFGYRIRDFGTGNDFGHKQNRDANGVTRGSYHILLPDGRIQNVVYHADDTGFHADVSFEGTERPAV
uniref:Pro-resilin n=1 Tax=Musca domestica TaxID=7370 RepID=A0A1I8N824_MUSDO